MKHIVIASLASLSLFACVEPEEDAAIDLVERAAPNASLPELPSDQVADKFQCGDGDLIYYDWKCYSDGAGWTLQPVGYREYVCDTGDGTSGAGPLVGRMTTCKGSTQSECSSNLPSTQCSWEPYGQHCPLPKPTTFCYVRPPLPPLPPVFPPGGGVNG